MAFVYYLKPSSFCFGVKRSIDELTKIVDKHKDSKIYCIHSLVHNPKITRFFEEMGVIFVESLNEVKESDSIVVFSAHWINREKLEKANKDFKFVYNLECPFVSKIYHEIDFFLGEWIKNFVYIWKEWHQEARNVVENIVYKWWKVFNIMNEWEIAEIPFDWKFAILSQTTLNYGVIQELISKIKDKFLDAIVPNKSDICKATYERQWVIKKHKDKFENLVVIWWKESSNTKELCEIGLREWKNIFFAESFDDLQSNPDFVKQKKVDTAVTWWASTPIEDIFETIDYYKNQWYQYEILEF